MKALPTLQKLAQRRIDSIGVEIANAQAAVDGLRTHRALISARAETEVDNMAELDILMASALPAYLSRSKGELAKVDKEIQDAEALIDAIRQRLMAAYREKARLETLQKLHLEHKLHADKAKEQASLDEAALTRRN